MATLTAEVAGNYDTQGDAGKLLYAPLDQPVGYRRTRVYVLEYEGEPADAEAFVRRVLLDRYAEEVTFGGAPAVAGYTFHLDYRMRPGALDLEKEAILTSYRGARHRTIKIVSLQLTQRIYIFSEGEVSAAPFIRDVCNSAIHVWNATDADGRNVA